MANRDGAADTGPGWPFAPFDPGPILPLNIVLTSILLGNFFVYAFFSQSQYLLPRTKITLTNPGNTGSHDIKLNLFW